MIDVSLPDGDGIRFYSVHKDTFEGRGIPAVFLSASTDIENKLTALRLGAEDYLCKPIHPLELKVRIQSKLERAEKVREETKQIRVGGLAIDLDRQQAFCVETNDTLDLTGLEFRLLLHFSKNVDRVLSREQILDQVWGRKWRFRIAPSIHMFLICVKKSVTLVFGSNPSRVWATARA